MRMTLAVAVSAGVWECSSSRDDRDTNAGRRAQDVAYKLVPLDKEGLARVLSWKLEMEDTDDGCRAYFTEKVQREVLSSVEGIGATKNLVFKLEFFDAEDKVLHVAEWKRGDQDAGRPEVIQGIWQGHPCSEVARAGFQYRFEFDNS